MRKDLYEKVKETVAAFQWFPEMGQVGGVISAKTFGDVAYSDSPYIQSLLSSDNVFVVITPKGPVTIHSGDYVISHQNGTQSVLPVDQFEEAYRGIAL